MLVHYSHVAIAVLLAWSFAQGAGGQGWPGEVLSDPAHPNNGTTFALVTALWVGIISFSVLIHELGHALSSLAFGYRAVIQLIGMGGVTQTLPREENEALELPWHHELFIVLAGPAAGLGLGLVAGAASFLGAAAGHWPDWLLYVLRGMFGANLFWAVLNLMPVAPLDGGSIARVVLMQAFGRRGFLFAQILALLVASLAVLAGLALNARVLALLFGLYVFRAISLINAYRRGEAPAGAAAHPLAAKLLEAEAFAAKGQLDAAEQAATEVLNQPAPSALISRAHAIVGWVAVKRGDGKRALEHFNHADANVVTPQALAAAHSLAGDDAAALPLWEKAAAATGEAVVRHEWAGALIRLGREAEARRLPDLRLALAFAAAERVHFLRGEFAQAAAMAEASFREEPSATAAYDAACAWSLAHDPAAAMRCLTLAAQNGFDRADTARTDPDLKNLRGSPEFEAWLEALPEPKPAAGEQPPGS